MTRTSRWPRLAKIAAITASVVVMLATLTGYAAFHHYLGKMQRIDVFGFGGDRPTAAAFGAQNFLLVGSDSRQGLSRNEIAKYHLGIDVTGARSDTMIILHVSRRHDRAMLVSLPRDSYVEIPAFTDSHGQVHPAHKGKLNSAYSEGGARLSVQTIERATGVRLDHYVEINVLGFAQMVDALGGVPVCLTSAVHDRDSGLDLSAGNHVVDGTQGLAFVRARHAFGDGSDLGRIKRQQQFLGAMMRKAMSSGTLLDPLKLTSFLDAAMKSVQVDQGLSLSDIRTLATAMRHLDPSHVTFLTVPLADTNYSVPGVGSTVLWDPTLSHQLFSALRDDTPLTAASLAPPKLVVPPSSIAVRVLNGTRTHGLAASVARALSGLGFRMAGPVGNADSHDRTHSTVLYPAGRADSAHTVVAAVPGATLQQDDSVTAVTLVIGADYTSVVPVHVGASPSPTATSRASGSSTSVKSQFDTTTAADNVCSKA